MTQYWIQTPIENAKEVVQRKIDQLVTAGTLPLYAGYTVSYDENCEVVLDGNALNLFSFDANVIYFGTFVLTDDSVNCSIRIEDNDANSYTTGDWENYPPVSGSYPYMIWNNAPQGWNASKGYFFGYKFTLTPPSV